MPAFHFSVDGKCFENAESVDTGNMITPKLFESVDITMMIIPCPSFPQS